MTQLICTPCGLPLADDHSAIYAIEKEGKLHFGWTGCHTPVGDVAVVLGSYDCAIQWVLEHPEDRPAIDALLDGHKKQHLT